MTPRAPIRTTGDVPDLGPKERALWAAVLEAAVQDIRRDLYRKDRERDADRAWFGSETVRPGAFVWICELMNLDPDAIRATL